MPTLELDVTYPLRNLLTEISPNDTMFDSSAHYVNVGLSALKVLEYAIARQLIAPEGPRTILDLPCGHGRCGRVLRSRFPQAELTVCDLDRDGVDFCASRLGATGVYSSVNFDELDLEGPYDMIWVSSLITHLKVEDTAKFIRCMEHHLSQAGLLVISNHGNFVVDRISAQEYSYDLTPQALEYLVKRYQLTGYGYVDYDGVEGYGISVISRHWLEGFFANGESMIVDYLDHELDDHHDVLFAKKRLGHGATDR
jgi:Methyltransferase domain